MHNTTPSPSAAGSDRSHGVTKPSTVPANTRKTMTPTIAAPTLPVESASASVRVRRPGSMSARAMLSPAAPARAKQLSSSSPWGTTSRTNWENPPPCHSRVPMTPSSAPL